MDIRLSIIIPTYNMARFLGQCLDSLLPDLRDDVEIIVVNDGSTDNVHQVFEGIKYDSQCCDRYPNLMIVDQPNKGTSEARNAGLRQARGLYWTTVDPDDTVPAGGLDALIDAAAANGDPDWVLGGFAKYDGGVVETVVPDTFSYSGQDTPLIIFTKIQKSNWVTAWAKLYKKSVTDNFGLWFVPGMAKHEDVEFNCRYLRHVRSVVTVGRAVYNYFIRCDSAMSKFKGQPQLDALRLVTETRRTTLSVIFNHEYHKDVFDNEKCEICYMYLSMAYVLYRSRGVKHKYLWLKRIANYAAAYDPEWISHLNGRYPKIFRMLSKLGLWCPHIVLSLVSLFPQLRKRLRG